MAAEGDSTPGTVSCEWLRDALERKTPDLILLDVTWYSDKDARQLYNEKHIAGARFFDVFQGATHTATHARNIPPEGEFEAHARDVGVKSDSHVIVYDSVPGKFGLFLGSRAWWMFRLFGHTKVSVLDGGLDKWQALGFPTTTEVPKIERGDLTVRFNSALIRHFDEMTAAARGERADQVLDTRPTAMFAGNAEDSRTGHLKGAASAPFPLSFVDQATGTLKTHDQLKAAFEAVGVRLDAPIVGMCSSGMSSCTVALCAYELGNRDATVYLGSFTEWKQRAPDDLVERS